MSSSSILTPTPRRTSTAATVSLVMGVTAFFGLPAWPLMKLIAPKTSPGLFMTTLGLQLLLAVGAVVLGLGSKPAADGHRPARAHAGITLGGLTLTLCGILALALTFNYVGNSVDRSVAETEPIILHQE